MQTKLWEIRKSNKMNQSEVADILGITVQAYRLKSKEKINLHKMKCFH